MGQGLLEQTAPVAVEHPTLQGLLWLRCFERRAGESANEQFSAVSDRSFLKPTYLLGEVCMAFSVDSGRVSPGCRQQVLHDY